MAAKRRFYPWSRLDRPGAWFMWRKLGDEKSLRAQASKQSRSRSIEIAVNLAFDYRPNSRARRVLLVTYVRGLF